MTGAFVNSYNLEATRASSNFDQRHLVNMSYVYDVPFFTKAGILHTLLGGWQWSGLFTFQSGTPFSVTNGALGDNAGVGNGVGAGSYVDVIGNPYATPSNPNISGSVGPLLYNPAAFAEPTGLTFGDAGRNILNYPSRWNLDTGIIQAVCAQPRAPVDSVPRRGFQRVQPYAIQRNKHRRQLLWRSRIIRPATQAALRSGNTFLTATAAHNPRILQLGMKFIF